MAYTFGDQLDFLASLLGDSETDSSSMWPLAQRKTEINHAEKQFARDSKMLLENTTGTVSSMEISVPSGWLETFALYVTVSGTKYKVTNRREVSPGDLERWNTYSGDFPYYYFWGFSGTRKIKLLGSSSSINGSSYEWFYYEMPTTDLNDTTDTSIIPEEYRKAPSYLAAANLLLQVGQYQRASVLRGEYDRLVAQGRLEANKWYMEYDTPNPDQNIHDGTPVDIQGQGNWW